ncbi:MAG: TetR/AcrR family transcriptional regulator [Ilumatobacteraceae bacterium]
MPSRGGREALVEAVLAELAEKGPANIYPNDISTGLGLSKSLVNFHFGDRDGLVAEAMAVGYERYVDCLMVAAEAAGTDPVARLLAWIDRQFEWTIENVGLAAALNFPYEAAALDGVGNPAIAERLAATGRRNLINLSGLVHAALRHFHGEDSTIDQLRLYFDVGVIGWMTLGMSVFTAGRHLPTRDLAERRYTEQAKQHLHNTVVEMLKR